MGSIGKKESSKAETDKGFGRQWSDGRGRLGSISVYLPHC